MNRSTDSLIAFYVIATVGSVLISAPGLGAQQTGSSGVDTQRPTMDVNGAVYLPEFSVPLSIYLSEPARRTAIKDFADHQDPRPYGVDMHTASIGEIREAVNRTLAPVLECTKANYSVRSESRHIAGIPTLIATPAGGVKPRNRSRVLINLHGGGFDSGGGGIHGLSESIPIAAVANIKVITVDYRQGPENVFPAASEDVAAVYMKVLKTYPAKNIGIWGGDSRYLTAPLQGDNPLSIIDASHATPSQVAYLVHADLTDPLVSAAYAPDVLARFPTTLLVTGTRATN